MIIKGSSKKAFALIYIMLVIFIIFMLAIALVNIVEKTGGFTNSKLRMAQRWEALNVGTALGLSYLSHLINSSPSILPNSNRLINDGYGSRNGRVINNFSRNLGIRVYIFDMDVVDYYWSGGRNLNTLISDLRNGGVNQVINRDNNSGPEGAPYLILTEVTNTFRSTNSRIYQLAIVDLENFNRFAYFTNVELTPTNEQIWFLAGLDSLTGPVHTNGQTVRIFPYGNFYNQNPPGPFLFNGPFSFGGPGNIVNTEAPGFRLGNNSYGNPTNFYNRTFANGMEGVRANAPEVKLPPDDPNDPKNTLRQVWPDLIGNGGAGAPTSQRGIFVSVRDGKIESGLYIRDTDTLNILHSLDLGVAQQNGQVFPKYTFQF
ncbi:MAG: hypothetical protein ACK4GJ_04655, partial [bacterium]